MENPIDIVAARLELRAALQGARIVRATLELALHDQERAEDGATARQLEECVDTPLGPKRPWLFVKADDSGLVAEHRVSFQRSGDIRLAYDVARREEARIEAVLEAITPREGEEATE